MEINAATAALLGAGISGFFSAVTAICVVMASKRSEERRHLRDVVLKTAIENWRVGDQASIAAGEPRLPLDVYVIHMLKFSDILMKKGLTVQDLRENQAALEIVVDESIRLTTAYSQTVRDRKQQ